MTVREENGLKKFMVGLSIAVLVQTFIYGGMGLWWGGGIEVRVQHVESDIAACCPKQARTP